MNKPIPIRPSPSVDQTGRRVIPNVSIEASLLVEKFKSQAPMVETAYGELTGLLGCSMEMLHRYISTTRRILLRDHAVYLETVRGVGVRVANDSGKLNAGARDMGSARRALGRASRKLESVEYKNLTAEERREYNARGSVLGALKLLGASSAVKRLEHEGVVDLMPSAKVLEMFKN